MAKRAGAMIAEAAGNHPIYVSKPDEVVKLIEQAPKAVSTH